MNGSPSLSQPSLTAASANKPPQLYSFTSKGKIKRNKKCLKEKGE
jgi:hypothetical protein